MHRSRSGGAAAWGLAVCLWGATAAAQSPTPTPPTSEALPVADPAASGLYVEFGRGVQLIDAEGGFKLTLRGRLQTRATLRTRAADDAARDGVDAPLDALFQVRRARLVFLGALDQHHLEVYIQLGVGPADVERDQEVPLRDGVITWRGLRDASLRVGQMKVPFNRERLVSSSALQMVDRSLSNGELNLDRDTGVQLFSNDLLGLGGVLGYQVGVYGGEGRNRVGEGLGLLYVARVQVNPGGAFDDLVEADLKRLDTPRLSLGLAGGFHHDAVREQGTTGAFYPDAITFDLLYGAADLIFKWRGLSLQAEVLARTALDPLRLRRAEGGGAIAQPARVGLGAMAQAGWVFGSGVELCARYSEIRPLGDDSALDLTREVHSGLGYYFSAHNLKLQSDLGVRLEEQAEPAIEGRLQLQLFF